MSKWNCLECNHLNNSHAKYCINCGEFKKNNELANFNVAWLCPICKEKNPDSASYCIKCGHWLLSENYTATAVKTDQQYENTYIPEREMVVESSQSSSKLLITEIILLGITSLFIFTTGGSLKENISAFLAFSLVIHIVFSLIYIVKYLFEYGFFKAFIMGFKQVIMLFIIFIPFMLIDTDVENNSKIDTYAETSSKIETDAKTTVMNNAVELEYEDLLRNAEGKYKNTYVKISGTVYYLEKQKIIMVETSNGHEVYYIKRNEKDETLIENDEVTIYGVVTGIMPTQNINGAKSFVPAVKSYSVILHK